MTTATQDGSTREARPSPAPIPLSRIVTTELRKALDTRSGFWLITSIAIISVLSAAAVVLVVPDRDVTYDSFIAAAGGPIAFILPLVALLSVTSEWSQRSGLTTFALVPDRRRIVLAKGLVAVLIGVPSILAAFGIGAVGNLIGSALADVPVTWDAGVSDLLLRGLGNIIGMLVGFMLGVLIRNSPGAIVGYCVYSFLLPGMATTLANHQEWFRKAQPWVDLTNAQWPLFDGAGTVSATEWSQLLVSGIAWLVAPLAVGVWSIMRSEVK
jgi:ABC-2 type transport system permease protein